MPRLKTDDGASLYYRLYGKAHNRPPLILVHGWCSRQEHWAPLIRHFSRRCRVLTLDRRGMGRSTTVGSGHSADQQAADIAAIASVAQVRGAIVIGHAGAGPVTLTLANKYPRLVKAAVLVESPFYDLPRLGDPKDVFGTTLSNMIDALQGPRGKQALKQMYTGYFSPKFDRVSRKRIVAEALETPLDTAIAELQMMIISAQDLADGISKPVLWLTAKKVDQEYIGSHLRRVQFGQVVGASHFPQLEVPAQTNAMIETFIEQL